MTVPDHLLCGERGKKALEEHMTPSDKAMLDIRPALQEFVDCLKLMRAQSRLMLARVSSERAAELRDLIHELGEPIAQLEEMLERMARHV